MYFSLHTATANEESDEDEDGETDESDSEENDEDAMDVDQQDEEGSNLRRLIEDDVNKQSQVI